MPTGMPNIPRQAAWLAKSTKPGAVIGFDPQQLPHFSWRQLVSELREAESESLNASNENSQIVHSSHEQPIGLNALEVGEARPAYTRRRRYQSPGQVETNLNLGEYRSSAT
ncbi:unnamed protein product [Protopolystoma xenopodis]|uniref:Uncharacterized protein n=1 Tax=Protopolystoma xenopodis TaxID=117903 RepID=A0A3S4ZVP7_9PLAT|nr:unnamed protein product [Protopolystoma xenopodis]